MPVNLAKLRCKCGKTVTSGYRKDPYPDSDWATRLGKWITQYHLDMSPYCNETKFEIVFDHNGSSFVYESPQILENNLVFAERPENKLILWLRS